MAAPAGQQIPPPPAPKASTATKVNAAAINSKIITENFNHNRLSLTDELSRTTSRSILAKGPTTSWTSIKTMPKDIADYAIDHMVTTDLKKVDIDRHSTDEKLDQFQRALLCLKSTEDSERIYVATRLDTLIQQNADRTFNEIVPGFIEELRRLNVDFHCAAAKTVVNAFQNLYAKNAGRAKELIGLIYQYVDTEDSSISTVWTDAFLELMNFLSTQEQEKEFGPIVVAKAKSSSANARKASCLLLTKLLRKVSPDFGARQLVPLVGTLCQDAKPEVKGTMCLELPFISQYFQPKESIMQYLIALAKDADAFVKTSLISTIRQLFGMSDMKATFAQILPLMQKIVKEAYAANNLPLLQEFSLDASEIANALSDAEILNLDAKLWFLDAILQMCRYGLSAKERRSGVDMPAGFQAYRNKLNVSKAVAESLISSAGAGAPAPKDGKGSSPVAQGWICRVNAAKGFASFVKFAKDAIDFSTGLHPLIIDLSHDPVPLVRAAIAGNILPIMQLLVPKDKKGTNHGLVLRSQFKSALADDDMAVIEAIVPCIGEILLILRSGDIISPDHVTQDLVDLGGAIIFCEERLQATASWRTHAKLLEQLPKLPECFPGDYIYDKFLPNLFNRLIHLRQMPCRLAAADTIVTMLRLCRRANQRDEIRKRIKDSFAHGKSFQDRMLYLVMSKSIIENFSRKYFREYFFEQTLNMADDPVANVRLKLCGMIPDVHGTLKDADDERFSNQLDLVINKIRSSETDRDVQTAMKNAFEEMKRMDELAKKMEKKYKGGKTPDDIANENKYREEQYIASKEPPPTHPVPPPPPPKTAVPAPPKVPEKPKPEPPKPEVKVARKSAAPKPASGTKIPEQIGISPVSQEARKKENPLLADAARLQKKAYVPQQTIQKAGPSGQQQQPKK